MPTPDLILPPVPPGIAAAEAAAAELARSADAVRVRAGADRPIVLTPDSLWVVASGQVDVFSVRIVDDVVVSRRTHLARVPAGGILLGAAPVDAWLFLGVGTSGTEVVRVPVASAQHRPAAELAPLLECWVERLYDGIAHELVPECQELDEAPDVPVAAGKSVRPRGSVLWVRHLDGHSHLLGRSALVVNGAGLLPVSFRAWMRADGPARLQVSTTGAVGAPETLWAGLERMHDLVLRCAATLASEGESQARARLVRRLAAKRQSLLESCEGLLNVMQRRRTGAAARTVRRAVTPDADLLPIACRVVGDALGVPITAPARTESAGRSTLADIARASRLRTRAVLLRDDWWRHDHGPLLAFREANGAPCALVPRRGGMYILHDPSAAEAHPLDSAEAATLAPTAYSFYRPFPDTPLNAADLLRFGLRDCGGDIRTVVTITVLASLLAQMPPIAMGMLFNSVVPTANRGMLLQLTIVLVVVALTGSVFQMVRNIAMLRIETRMSTAVQAAVWDRLLSLPMTFFRPYAAGDLAVRSMGIDAIRQVISGTTITALFGGMSGLFSIGLMFTYSAPLAWRALALILLAVVVTVAGGLGQLAPMRQVSEVNAKTSGLVLQLLSAVGKIRTAGAEVHAFAAWARRFSQLRAAQYSIRTLSVWMQTFTSVFPLAAMIVLFWSTAVLMASGTALRTGDFLAFLAAFTAASAAAIGTCTALLGALNVLPLYEQARPILQARPEVDAAKADPGLLKGQIELQRVSFRYAADGPPTLRDVTLRIEPGQFVAFVGPSGSGKSTLLRILLGFETPETGVVYYDGQDVAGLDVNAVRRQIGVVLQNGRLRRGDIFTNIVGSSPFTVERAWDAARMAGFDADIAEMPMGMHTVVSEGGGTLSGGQRQRLLIAHALVHRPRMLFFDEATSALDNRTQAIVSRSLEQLQATRVVVAHRLSTIINADVIVVVERGRIVQTGGYEELLAQQGTFRELARRQLV